MRYIPYKKEYFFANYFWSVKEEYPIREDILVKTYLTNYFTFGDIVSLYFLVGKESLLKYAQELNMENRVLHLINKIKGSKYNDSDTVQSKEHDLLLCRQVDALS